MKNKSWLRLTGWLLALVMILTVMPIATLAETDDEIKSDTISSPKMQKRPAEVDVTAVFTYTNASGKATEPAKMNPNEANQMKLAVSGLNDHNEIGNNTVMAVTLPEDITVSTELQGFSSDAVSATLDGGKLLLSWKGEKQDSFEATVAVLPHLPAENDLSGSYVLGTAGNIPEKYTYRVMMTPNSFMDGSRARLKGVAFEEVDGKVYILSEDAASVWEMKHVTGNYYTVRSKDNGQYLKINTSTNGLLLEEATDFTAQKLLLEKVKEGYYAFKYMNKSINNSSFSAKKGFASFNDSDKGGNAILKLYNPSDVITEPIQDLSGTWVITNASKKNALTADPHSTNGRLSAVQYTAEGDHKDIDTFTFENIIRDWYTVKTDSGYLNISDKGASISNNPQHLVVKTNNNYSNIILSNNELYDAGYTLNNVNGKTNDGYGTVLKHVYNNNTCLTLVPAVEVQEEEEQEEEELQTILTFDKNGGTAAENPQPITGEAGEKVVLPELNATKNSQEFIGWAEVSNIYAVVAPGINHTYHVVYKPGTSYTMKAGSNTLYAVYNTVDRSVRFGIRQDGVIQDEPRDNKETYIGHFIVNGILKEGHWVIDINSAKPVNGYYVENDVTAALNWVPSAEEIAAALKEEGNVEFNPETQYIHYYVLKYAKNRWQIDGVIRNKANVEVSYNTNVPKGTDKTKVTNMPGGYQVAPGTDILIGADKNSTTIKRPGISGYFFIGWNTEADGSGEYYHESTTVHLTENLNLYAQWVSEVDNPLEIRITSDWTKGKVGYIGAKIKLTASLTGFEGKQYTLQWQYSTDQETWIDVPDAHDITYTYILDETTTTYTWRCVAQDIR